jgi:TIR domain-containing protein
VDTPDTSSTANAPNAPNSVFISYRRADSADIAGRIYDRLVERFGEERVFKDVDSIQPGVAFADYIVESIGQSAVELVIIGPRWLTVSTGVFRGRRLDDPGDYVRLEIETALKYGVPVIPVLVAGASMPSAGRLPDSLKRLVERNGIQVRPDPDFRRDMERVIAAAEYWISRPRPAPAPSAPIVTPDPPPSATPSAPASATPLAQSAPMPPVSTPPAQPSPSAAVQPAASRSAPPPSPAPVRGDGAPTRKADAPPTRPFRRYQPFIAIGALVAVVALLVLTLHSFGGIGGPGDSPAAATQTADARAALAQFQSTATAQARQLTEVYQPKYIGTCDTVAPPWSQDYQDYWRTRGELHYLSNGTTEFTSGSSAIFYGFPAGFPAAFQVSFKFSFKEASACFYVYAGATTPYVEPYVCGSGQWSLYEGNAQPLTGRLAPASSHVLTWTRTASTSSISLDGRVLGKPAPNSGPTQSISIQVYDGAIDVSSFVLRPTV